MQNTNISCIDRKAMNLPVSSIVVATCVLDLAVSAVLVTNVSKAVVEVSSTHPVVDDICDVTVIAEVVVKEADAESVVVVVAVAAVVVVSSAGSSVVVECGN